MIAETPTADDLRRMRWARKAVYADGTTRGRFRWPVGAGGWVTQDVPESERDGAACGVGLHLGLTVMGLSVSGPLTERLLLVVGWLPEDEVGSDADKMRVTRCWVVPGVHDTLPRLLRAGWGRHADLSGANLRDSDLCCTNLRHANLCNANLCGADLPHANLRHANLRHANLRHANLRYANLRGADLRYADLSGADLRYADLSGADLRYATWSAKTMWPKGFTL